MEEAADTDIMEDMYRRYENLTDEEILLDIKEHNNKVALDYLINKYRNFVRAKARSYFLIGADREDIVQEGMIGFYKAIRDFRDDKLSSFRAFAELCVTRQIITAIKTATRQKHIPLNSYVSLNKPIYDEDSDRTLLDIISGAKVSDPEELVISQEEFVDIEKKMEEILSDLEWKVLMSYLDGKSYQEIAEDPAATSSRSTTRCSASSASLRSTWRRAATTSTSTRSTRDSRPSTAACVPLTAARTSRPDPAS